MAKLIDADLRAANLSGANLFMALLSGANLSTANITQEQLDFTYGNSSTILPIRGVTLILRAPHFIPLKHPKPWSLWW